MTDSQDSHSLRTVSETVKSFSLSLGRGWVSEAACRTRDFEFGPSSDGGPAALCDLDALEDAVAVALPVQGPLVEGAGGDGDELHGGGAGGGAAAGVGGGLLLSRSGRRHARGRRPVPLSGAR